MTDTTQPGTGNRATTPRRRYVPWAILAIAATLAAVIGVRRWQYASTHESTENAQVDGHIVPVLARVGGYVRTISVSENDTVRRGDVLVQLEDAEYRQRLAQAEAEWQAALVTAGGGSAAGQAQAQVASASGQHAALDAQLVAARAQSARAMADLARAEDLAGKRIVSQQQLDAARTAAEAARAGIASLESQARAAGAGVVSAEAGVRLARARLLAARAARDNAALQLGYTTLVAPEGGMVARKAIEIGQLVQPGQPLMTVVGTTGVWVTANLKETQLAHTRVGQDVALHVDAYTDCLATGRVASIASATGSKFALLPPDNATGNFTKVVQRIPVRVEITQGCGADRPLRPGMSVTATIDTHSPAPANGSTGSR
ncbi:MAG: HlyD family secretion protein [Gemmatimonadaceae bacterium]|nr:HlyD family secretion protein [Gemmatimonadaceae bacterium]